MEIEFGTPGTPSVIQQSTGLPFLEANAAILRERRWKYVHFNGDLPPLLFDLESDPAETKNLANNPTHRDELLRLTGKMLDHRMTHQFKKHSATVIGAVP
jgi:arylsulfatase A-like enzyme